MPTPSSLVAPRSLDLPSSLTARAAERERLRSLHRSNLLDSGDEERFDRLTRRARSHFGVTTAIISLVAEDRQYLKSSVGSFPRSVPREVAICNVTIQSDDAVVVSDLLEDERFSNSPFVLGHPFIRFYAGMPLRGPGGWFVGSLCILDTEPRCLDRDELLALRRLADLAELEMNSSAQHQGPDVEKKVMAGQGLSGGVGAESESGPADG